MTEPPFERGASPSFGLILRSLDRVEAAIIAIGERFDGLNERFVPRAEVLSLLQTGADQRAALADDLRETSEKLDKIEERRRSDWKFTFTAVLSLAGLGLTALGIAVTVLIFILNHK